MKPSNENLPTLSLGDVKKGDVILSCGSGDLSEAIRILDGGDYSHSAICYKLGGNRGPFIIEATKAGVVENQLKEDIDVQQYLDVYRFKSDSGETFASKQWPPHPVIDKAVFYKNQGSMYAYNQLMLMGVLVLARKVPIGKLGQAKLRYWLAQMIEYFKATFSNRKNTVTCSELVYRCFYEAKSIPEGKYGLTIRGTIGPDGMLIKAFSKEGRIDKNEIDQNTRGLLQKAENLFWQIKPDLHTNLRDNSGEENNIGIKAANPNVCADMVTPHDLQKSHNFDFIGRLRH